MTAFAVAGLIVIALVCLFAGVNAFILARRVRELRLQVKTLRDHPVLLSLRRIGRIQASLASVPERIALVGERAERIALRLAEIGAAWELLGREVNRVSWATKLMLVSLLPAMRGFFAD